MQKSIEQNITTELAPIAEQALSFTIAHEEDMRMAVSLLSQLNRINDRIAEEREKVTKPLNEALKAERARWKPTELKNTTAIEALRAEMTRYQTQALRQKQMEEQKIADKVATGYIKTDTAVTKLESLPSIQKTTSTDDGSVTFVEKKQLLITNQMLIPREYLIPDEDKIIKDLKDNKTIPGAELETILVPRNSR